MTDPITATQEAFLETVVTIAKIQVVLQDLAALNQEVPPEIEFAIFREITALEQTVAKLKTQND